MQDPFENFMDAMARELRGDWYDGKVAGVTHRNADGSHRQQIIRTLGERDELQLRPEPENKFDPNAIAVLTPAGDQVGYLDARLAGELTRRIAEGRAARCFVRALREGREVCGLSFGLVEYVPASHHI